ncbi:MAG: glycosyltransferase family 9 protein [Vampirovibrio sp.]|nr:glycosyltransferase family 9 protein [Vampirovibrio sp.]
MTTKPEALEPLLLAPPNRILVIPLRFIGDTVLSVPFIRNVATLFPQAQLDVLVSKTAKPLLENCPYIHTLIEDPVSGVKTIQLLQKGFYDVAFSLRESFSTILYCRLAGIATVVGYDHQRLPPPIGYKRWGLLLSRHADYPKPDAPIHQVQSHLNLLRACGLVTQKDDLELWSTQQDEKQIDDLLAEHSLSTIQPLAVIHTTSASAQKKTDPTLFEPVISTLHDKGYRVIATGAPGDRQLYEKLSNTTGIPLVNLAGKTSLTQTYALYRRIQLIVTVDSGPIHIAAAAYVPQIIGLYGPTNPAQWGPYSAVSKFTPVMLQGASIAELQDRIITALDKIQPKAFSNTQPEGQ